MRSRILYGKVWHMRTSPRYFFQYGAFYLDLDLDELDEVNEGLRLFAFDRLNLLSLHRSDYLVLAPGEEAHSGPRPLAHEREAGAVAGASRLSSNRRPPASGSLITHPRVLNFAFNPVSFLLSRNQDGTIAHVTAEVHNTWGERHPYELAASSNRRAYHSEAEKDFYVSPFIDMQGHYEFLLDERDGRLRIRLDEYRSGEERAFFRAGMDLRSLPLTDANILRMVVRFPLVTIKTVAAIHWQGLKLWLRGERFRPNPSRARKPAEVAR